MAKWTRSKLIAREVRLRRHLGASMWRGCARPRIGNSDASSDFGNRTGEGALPTINVQGSEFGAPGSELRILTPEF